MKIIIVGAGASGKSTLVRKLKKNGYKQIVQYTSRPIRRNEAEGVDYKYRSSEYIKNMIDTDSVIEYIERNGWYYATNKEDWDNGNILLVNPTCIPMIKEKTNDNVFVIYLNIHETIRKRRLLNRNDSDSVDRRLQTDREDFEGFTDFDVELCSNEEIDRFEIKKVVD